MLSTTIANLRTKQIIACEIIIAHTFWLRLRGLIARKPLKKEQTIWIKPCQQVHTHWMGYPLHVVYLDDAMRVIHIVRDLKPWRFAPLIKSAHSVIELNASFSYDVELGDVLAIDIEQVGK